MSEKEMARDARWAVATLEQTRNLHCLTPLWGGVMGGKLWLLSRRWVLINTEVTEARGPSEAELGPPGLPSSCRALAFSSGRAPWSSAMVYLKAWKEATNSNQ